MFLNTGANCSKEIFRYFTKWTQSGFILKRNLFYLCWSRDSLSPTTPETDHTQTFFDAPPVISFPSFATITAERKPSKLKRVHLASKKLPLKDAECDMKQSIRQQDYAAI